MRHYSLHLALDVTEKQQLPSLMACAVSVRKLGGVGTASPEEIISTL